MYLVKFKQFSAMILSDKVTKLDMLKGTFYVFESIFVFGFSDYSVDLLVESARNSSYLEFHEDYILRPVLFILYSAIRIPRPTSIRFY